METVLVILGAIVAIAVIIGLYYLFKILIGYIVSAILYGFIFGALGAILGKFISVDMMWKFMLYGAIGGAVIGLVIAILRTKDFAKARLASNMYHDLIEGDPIGTEYTVRDQNGQTVKVKKTGRGMLGESFLEDSDGNHYKGQAGSGEVERL